MHVDQELLVYEAFPHDSQLGQGNLKVRFKKVQCLGRAGCGEDVERGRGRGLALTAAVPPQVPHGINFREKKPKPSKKKAEGGSAEEGAGARGRVARFRYFEDIYGYSGVGWRLQGSLGWGRQGSGPSSLLTLPAPRCSSAAPRPTGSW